MFTEPKPDAPRVALVGCSARKLDRAAPARSFYTSALFRAALAYAEATCDRVLVVSALHGAVELDTQIEPYNRSLRTFGKRDREAWGARTVAEVLRKGEPKPVLVIVAGQVYADALVHGAHWHNLPRPEEPLRGIKGCGARIAWLQQRTPNPPPVSKSYPQGFVQRLHNEYSEIIRRTLLSLGFRGPVLEDLLQEALLVSLRRAEFIPTEAGPWFVNTTRKLVANYRRRHWHRFEELDPDAGGRAEGGFKLATLLNMVLEELDEPDRELIIRYYLAGESVEQLEQVMGWKHSTVYLRLRAAKARLRVSVRETCRELV